MKVINASYLQDRDKICALLGSVGSAVLFLYFGVLVGHVIYTLIAVMTLFTCLLWLSIRKHVKIARSPLYWHSNSILSLIFFLLLIVSILSISFRSNVYERPLVYFVITSLMVGVIACEILHTKRRHAFILLQIILLGISITWSQLLIFPDLVGNDPWYHRDLTLQILNVHNIPNGYGYTQLPLFHLLIGITSLLTGLDYKISAILSASLGQIICNILFIYILGKYIFDNPNVGLLASLMVIIGNYHIFMTVWSIPNALGVVFIPILLYTLLFLKNGQYISRGAMSILIMVAIILTHTIAALSTVIVLFASWSGLFISRDLVAEGRNLSLRALLPLGFCVFMLSWWTYASGSLDRLGNLIKWGFSIDVFDSTPSELRDYIAVPTVPLVEQIFNNLGFFAFFTLSFIGIFYMLSRNGNRSTFAMTFPFMIPLLISFASQIMGFAILGQRWWFLSQLFLSIPLAVGLLILCCTAINKNSYLFEIIIILIVASLSFLNIVSPQANGDNNIFSPNSNMRIAPIESELSATIMLNKYDGVPKTDSYFALRVFTNTEPFCKDIITADNINGLKNYLVIVRDAILTKPFILFSNYFRLDYDLAEALDSNNFSKIYNSGSTYAYL